MNGLCPNISLGLVWVATLEKDLRELRHKVGLLKMQAMGLLNREMAA
jgi:hypothetical protein